MFEIDEPESRDSIAAGLERLHREIADYFGGLPTATFLEPQGEYWSPSYHLRHLVKSVRAVAKAMCMPKVVLGLLFGRHRAGSRSFDEVVQVYRDALDGGATAGKYTPSERSGDLSREEWRELVIERWRSCGLELQAAIRGWSEEQLDRYRIPHPLLGKMTVREILFFTLYHNAHHARRVEERSA